MENDQKITDYQILVKFIKDSPAYHSYPSPFFQIEDALFLLDQLESLSVTVSPEEFFKRIHDIAIFRGYPYSDNDESYYLLATITYVLLKLEGYNEKVLDGIESILKSEEGAHYNEAKINRVIEEIQNFRKSVVFYDPIKEIETINKGKALVEVDWQKLFHEIIRFGRFYYDKYPYYLILHTFLQKIVNLNLRIEVLNKLNNVAPNCLRGKELNIFKVEANWIRQIYSRIMLLLAENNLPTLWKFDSDLNELTLLMNDLKPIELVALGQSVLDETRKGTKAFGIIAHVLTIPAYLNKMVSETGLEFCKGLYIAEGYRQWIQSGIGSAYDDQPTLDTLSTEYRNNCYNAFLEYKIIQSQDSFYNEYNVKRTKAQSSDDVFQELQEEFKASFTDGGFNLSDERAYLSLKARMEELVALAYAKAQNEKNNSNTYTTLKEVEYQNSKFRYILSNDIDLIKDIHSRIELAVDTPSKLRDELYELHKEKLIRLPLNKPTDIIREVMRLWGRKAPAERSFVTAWGRLKTK